MSKPTKILSLVLCLTLCVNGIAYADTVVIGAAPNSAEKSVSQQANTTFLQNQYTGPGTLPTSSNNLGSSPLQQGLSIDYSSNTVGQAMVDSNNVSYAGPQVTNISSPAKHNEELKTSYGTVNIITNGANALGTPADNTSDTGPVSKEVAAPTANGNPTYITASGTIVGGQNIGEPQANNGVVDAGGNLPAYSTGAGAVNTSVTAVEQGVTNTDIILYKTNDYITAVKPTVQAPAALVVNATTRQIYFSKDGFGQYAPSGLANLVTAYLLATYKGLDDTLTVSASAVTGLESGANTCGLRAGDTIKVRDAIAALFVKSCCDVANVVAENVGGSIPNFVAMMNSITKNWGCVGTVFANPTGLNNAAQITNVYDMAIIMDKASASPVLKQFLTLSSYTLPATMSRGPKTLKTSNNIITPGAKYYYAGIGASRMGYTSKAKYTIASEIDYNGQRLIAVALKANGSQFTDMTKLLNFAKVASVEASAQGNQVTYNTSATTQMAQTTTQAATQVATQVTGTSTSANDTPGTWQQDSKGWYFLKSNGQKASNEWIKQGNKMYCVDTAGYMITGWREFSNGKLYYFEPTTGEFKHNTWVNVSTGAYYLQSDGTLATADKGSTKNIITSVGTYTIDENGKAIAKVN